MQTLKDIGSYKNKLLMTFLNSGDISDLMLGKSHTEDDVGGLIYTNIFPYLYVDETQTETKPYLCVEVDVPRMSNFSIKDLKVIVWAYCHKDIMKCSKKGYLGTRADILADMVDRELNGSNKYGIGSLKLEAVSYIMPNAKFYGKQLIYSCQDFAIKSR